jgi:hypothetical protein
MEEFECDCNSSSLIKDTHICRYFGSFQCHKCKRRWKSPNSWRSMKQLCNKCNRGVNPYKLELFKGSNDSDSKGPHDSERCEMCKFLGEDCSKN